VIPFPPTKRDKFVDSSSGRLAVTFGVIACFTGVGAVFGLPLIILGLLIMIFGSKPKK
jgi:hypothetical protein